VIAATTYDWLLFLHILAAMVWVGGLVTLTVLAGQIVRRGDAGSIARFASSLRTIGPFVYAPATVAVLALGIGLVTDTDAWNFGQTWIIVALTLFGAAFFIGAVFQSRSAIAATRAAEAGESAVAIRQLRRWLWGMRVILVLLVVITWDMTVKPGL
jgi:uncharacterized membrane protein